MASPWRGQGSLGLTLEVPVERLVELPDATFLIVRKLYMAVRIGFQPQLYIR